MAPVTSKHQNRLTDADDPMAVFSSWAGVSGKDRRKKVGRPKGTRPRVKSDRQHRTVSSAILLRRCVLLHCVCTRSLHMNMYIYVCVDM